MTTRRDIRRALLSAAALALAALAGCGGSDGGNGGGGDEAAYAKAYESACKEITKAPGELQAAMGKIDVSDGDAAVATIKQATTKVLDTVGRQYDLMVAAEAPDEFADFQESVRDGAADARKGIEQARAKVAEIETLTELANLGSALDGVDFGSASESLPEELAERAPACRALASA